MPTKKTDPTASTYAKTLYLVRRPESSLGRVLHDHRKRRRVRMIAALRRRYHLNVGEQEVFGNVLEMKPNAEAHGRAIACTVHRPCSTGDRS